MGSMSITHWIVVAVIVLVLFGGRGKISSLMGDMAQGIKAFKKGMSEDDTAKNEPVKSEHMKTINQQPGLANRAETEQKAEGSTL